MSEAGTADLLAPPATVADVQARHPGLDEGQAQVAEALLVDAWALVRVQAPTAVGWAADPLLASVLRQVLCAMVSRVLRNPDGVRQQGLDDYQVTLDASRASGALYLSPDELGAVRGALASGAPAPLASSRRLVAPWSRASGDVHDWLHQDWP